MEFGFGNQRGGMPCEKGRRHVDEGSCGRGENYPGGRKVAQD
jgi:hypothetical protein